MTIYLQNISSDSRAHWQQQANQYLIQGNYTQAENLYEQAIAAEPEVKSHYWHLGLMLLLQGQEMEAQTTWLLGMADGEAEQVDEWTAQLLDVLQTEADRREGLADYSLAWAIRQHIREINPADVDNLLRAIEISIQLETFTPDELTSTGLIEMLELEPGMVAADTVRLMRVLQRVLNCVSAHPSAWKFAETCIAHVREPQTYINIIIETCVELGYILKLTRLAINYIELGLRLAPNQPELVRHKACFYQNLGEFDEGIETAKLFYSLQQDLPAKVYATHLILRGLMSAGGYWAEALTTLDRLHSLLELLIAECPTSLSSSTVCDLFVTSFFSPYFQDDPKTNRKIGNQLAQLCQSNVQNYAKDEIEGYRQRQLFRKSLGVSGRPLKIGYLSHCLRRHSVGWLARWLFQHHDRDKFQIHAYFIGYKEEEHFLQNWYVNHVDKPYRCGIVSTNIAEQIDRDEIDILIDLDSITLDVNCEVMAMKPAPIQVTWLGWDAVGLPAIDYFIADPYVVPESAQDDYSEKIWRLPHTYIAVEGFEVGVPTLRRDILNIPSNAVVYLSSQTGYKRHPDTARLQVKILKQVPNSYFLIKGGADQKSIQKFFNQLAEEEGLEGDRLRFLPGVSSEEVHRANLGIADVVLDTYPYNGATTTLETLWMCIPLVTRVGQQFAARNSYTMMMNAGVTEGIAWTDEEYVEWGIRLGKDAALRQQISWKLRQSRQTSPLWNAQHFTREMEKAYEQMWEIYLLS
ncbi:MAG: O-linked N-acetylglucosamine transferase, SPINDLY family protein [Microcoleus sp. PH2017_40_RAT_O_B]|uniref:O-linked N-acetylglucosamine transferase, SPINDLY family protein n=1 Tax=unclassified Microcoleus TaxID=2642155 RepID=UPI001D4508C0|nr:MULTISPECIES: O-linked N-acetylglucosamine transferase, SPINDLY family protein [unclassified Microcoleus]MCC3575079.1 O-linked N-acetylglucosamine transferase, SPINDLY family protein [Microcoleus sp. PH2017_34_RAT_O_A]MCC3612691.1 O-linked N-acetylglucosamine transferase, SPINDLY family protein [Microcoleus sp. PH2017_40_RAT_O_B]